MKKEVKKNRDAFFERMNLQPSDAALYINGLHYDMDYVDIFTILEALKSEAKVLDGLGRLGVDDSKAAKLMTLDFSNSGSKQNYGIDVRDSAVNWINDLEKDKMYKNWPDSVMEMLRPTFPGELEMFSILMQLLILTFYHRYDEKCGKELLQYCHHV